MSWEPELEELKRREAFAEELGGAERVKPERGDASRGIRKIANGQAERKP